MISGSIPASPPPPMMMGGPPPPPPPPMMIGGPPPPPPPPMISGSIPPPPPMMSVPHPPPGMLQDGFPTIVLPNSLNVPPPPPPAIAGKTAPSADSGDLFDQIKSGNLKSRLKKVKPRVSPRHLPGAEKVDLSPEEAARLLAIKEAKLAEERQNLTYEVLGYMQTPNGSLEDLLDKATKSTNIARGFIYTLVRRKWVKGYRIIEENTPRPLDSKKACTPTPCTVFPGREWTSAIELPDISESDLSILYPNEQINIQHKLEVARAHMYRFDKNAQRHVLDEIVFFKSENFPVKFTPFTVPEPPQDNSLENRNKWELWNMQKLTAQQSDSAQYHLVYTKLSSTDVTTAGVFTQLESTISQMREMSDAVTAAFAQIPLDKLRTFVSSIPAQIKDVAKNLQNNSGIIINGDNLKLTPTFLEAFLGKGASEAAEEEKAEAQFSKRGSLVSLGGVPIHTLMPMLKRVLTKKDIMSSNNDRLSRRYTFLG